MVFVSFKESRTIFTIRQIGIISPAALHAHVIEDMAGHPISIISILSPSLSVICCATGARFYGDLDDPNSDAAKELAKCGEESIHRLTDSAETHPATAYILPAEIAAWKELV